MTDSGRDIPEHVLFDILLWLPVVSLLRFKCMCKSWRALVESSTFITKHLQCSNSSEGALIACGAEFLVGEGRNGIGFLMLIYGNEYQKCSKDYMQELLPSDIILNYGLVGSCDGIVCLRTSDIGDLALYNPAMKQLRHLPKPSFLTPPIEAGSRFDVIGFGFDFKTNDYKVVRVFFYADEPGSGIHNIKVVEVYSKRTDSWRILHKKGASLPFQLIDRYPQATNKNGTCFWIGEGFDDTCILVSFDLNGEVFGTMALPDADLLDRTRALDCLNDNLVYIKGVDRTCLYEPPSHKFFEIWVLHEFGNEESWNKIYKIGPIFQEWPIEYYYPIRLSKNGEFVVLIRDQNSGFGQVGALHLYNLRIQDRKYPLIQPPGCWAYELFHYNESLVSIKSL